jgi:hypothetical protein
MEVAALNITPQYHPRLLATDHAIRARVHILPPDVHWHTALTREYWHSCIGQLAAGDRVEVHSHDHKIQFLIFVFDCNDQTAQLRLDIGFAPLWPRDLELPAPMEDPALFTILPNKRGGFDIIETATGNQVAEAPVMLQARQMVSALEKREMQLREQAEAAAAAAAAADIEAAVAALAARATGDEAA